MKYLLDTGVWLWSLWEPERISRQGRQVLADLRHEVFLSAVTSWEVAIKSGAGKLKHREAPGTFVPRWRADRGLRPASCFPPARFGSFRPSGSSSRSLRPVADRPSQPGGHDPHHRRPDGREIPRANPLGRTIAGRTERESRPAGRLNGWHSHRLNLTPLQAAACIGSS